MTPGVVPSTVSEQSLAVMHRSPVIPVVVLQDVEHAVPLAKALLDGGIGVIEVTLRTPAGLPAIERIAAEVPEIAVGAGTITQPEQVAAVVDAGASFGVTPGSPAALMDVIFAAELPVLAGAVTLTEAMTLMARGHRALKFFPAEQSGGAAYLKAVAGPLPDAMFCPTGGINDRTAADYLALPSVPCVGGSWLAPADLLAAGDWAGITAIARKAAALR